MADSRLSSGADAAECDFYSALADFNQNAHLSSDKATTLSSKLREATENLLKAKGNNLSDGLIFLLAATIKFVLYRDSGRLVLKEQRSIPRPPNSLVMKPAFPIIYEIFAMIGFDRFKREIDGTTLYSAGDNLFICPRPPPRTNIKYTHKQFDLPLGTTPERIPFVHIQHAVHNIGDLFSILNIVNNGSNAASITNMASEETVSIHFTGGPNHAYHGPDLIWFSPRASKKFPAEVQNRCKSCNRMYSVYGSYVFHIPFKNLLKFKTYRLGTRNYNNEYCHTILFTKQEVQSVKLEEELRSVELFQTGLIDKDDDGSFQWLSYRTEGEKYDQIDFAVALSDLEWNTGNHGIKLDFIDHRDCVRNQFINRQRDCLPTTRADAMKNFIQTLLEKSIALDRLKPLFEDSVYAELQSLYNQNRTTMTENHD